MTTEEWRDVAGYEGIYKVSNFGSVINASGRPLKAIANPKYYRVLLSKGGKSKLYYVHRLVAAAFIGEIYDQVHHIDENKANNHVSNLKLCSGEENLAFHYDGRLLKPDNAHWDAVKRRWRAFGNINGKRLYAGRHKTREEASEAFKRLKKKILGEQ